MVVLHDHAQSCGSAFVFPQFLPRNLLNRTLRDERGTSEAEGRPAREMDREHNKNQINRRGWNSELGPLATSSLDFNPEQGRLDSGRLMKRGKTAGYPREESTFVLVFVIIFSLLKQKVDGGVLKVALKGHPDGRRHLRIVSIGAAFKRGSVRPVSEHLNINHGAIDIIF